MHRTPQGPPRNLFSRRIPQAPAPRNVVDYLDARRGVKPMWGTPDDRSPQWLALKAMDKSGALQRFRATLLSLTGSRNIRTDGPERLDRIVERYLADVVALDDQVDALNRLFAAIVLNHTRVPIDDIREPVAPSGRDTARLVEFYREQDSWRRRKEQEEKARARFAREMTAAEGTVEGLGPSIICAELLVRGRGPVLAACQADIARRCQAAGDHLWWNLQGGLRTGRFGIVSWHSADVCWYVRGEQHLRAKGHWSENSYERREVVKEVHLIDAMHLAGIPGWLPLPRPVRNVVDAIPPVLHPEIGTVVGTMVKEREISWLAGEVSYPEDRVLPQSQLLFDPAIVIGPVALTGWELPKHSRPGWWMQLDCALAR